VAARLFSGFFRRFGFYLSVSRSLSGDQSCNVSHQSRRTPASLANNVKALTGRDGIRLRVGDWRVIMDDQAEVLDVLKIGPRGGVYD
jgi:hypothetical protein